MKHNIEARVAQVHALFGEKQEIFERYQDLADAHGPECRNENPRGCAYAKKIEARYAAEITRFNRKLGSAIGKLHQKLDKVLSKAAR